MMEAFDNIKNKHAELCKIIEYHSYLYNSLDDPEITDSEYDHLFSELQKMESQNPELISESSPTQRVGSRVLGTFEQVQHVVPMLSLSNAFEDEEELSFEKYRISFLI